MVELEFFSLSLTKLHRLMHHTTACASHCMCAIDSLFGVYVLSSNIDVFDFAVKPLIFNYMALIIIGAILALKEAAMYDARSLCV